MLAGKNSRKPWNELDILVATAYQILESERCPQCGLYVWMCHTEDADMQFEVLEDACEAKRAVTGKEKQMGDKIQPWVTLRPRPIMADATRDFPDLRRPYFEQESKRLNPDPEG